MSWHVSKLFSNVAPQSCLRVSAVVANSCGGSSIPSCKGCTCLPPAAVAEVLRAIIGTYRELFKAPALTEAVLFSNYAATALVVDEVCREVGGVGAGRSGRCCECRGCARPWAPALQAGSTPWPARAFRLAATAWLPLLAKQGGSVPTPSHPACLPAGAGGADRPAEHTKGHCHAGERRVLWALQFLGPQVQHSSAA